MERNHSLLWRLLGPDSGRVIEQGARRVSLPDLSNDPSGEHFAAMIHAVWLVFAADAQLEDYEIQHLVDLIDDLTEGEADSDAIEELFDTYARLFADVGVSGSVTLIADVLREPELRESTLKLAIGAVCIDGTLSAGEERTLLALASAFGYTSRQTNAFLAEVEQQLSTRTPLPPPTTSKPT